MSYVYSGFCGIPLPYGTLFLHYSASFFSFFLSQGISAPEHGDKPEGMELWFLFNGLGGTTRRAQRMSARSSHVTFITRDKCPGNGGS